MSHLGGEAPGHFSLCLSLCPDSRAQITQDQIEKGPLPGPLSGDPVTSPPLSRPTVGLLGEGRERRESGDRWRGCPAPRGEDSQNTGPRVRIRTRGREPQQTEGDRGRGALPAPTQGPIRLLTPSFPHGLQALGPYPGQRDNSLMLLKFAREVVAVVPPGIAGVVGGAGDKSHTSALLSRQPHAHPPHEGLEGRPRTPPGESPSGTNEIFPELARSHL